MVDAMNSDNGDGNAPLVLVLTMVSVMLPALWKAQVSSLVPEPYLVGLKNGYARNINTN